MLLTITLKHLLVLSAVSAEMGIAKLHYAIAVEGLRQVGRIKVFMRMSSFLKPMVLP